MSAAETTTNTGLPIRSPNDARGATHAIDPLSDVHTAVKSATGTKIIALIDVSSRFALPIAQAAKEVRARFLEDRGGGSRRGARRVSRD